jgi:hypothetical protein
MDRPLLLPKVERYFTTRSLRPPTGLTLNILAIFFAPSEDTLLVPFSDLARQFADTPILIAN